VIPLCVELGISYVPYFPLASGLLTGKYRRARRDRLHGEAIEDEEYDRVEALERFARERGRTLLELAIAGLLSQPVIPSVIAGATKPEQVRANAAAAGWRPRGKSWPSCATYERRSNEAPHRLEQPRPVPGTGRVQKRHFPGSFVATRAVPALAFVPRQRRSPDGWCQAPDVAVQDMLPGTERAV
jgi:diketogulonate reductase-like aldo/keto reductase